MVWADRMGSLPRIMGFVLGPRPGARWAAQRGARGQWLRYSLVGLHFPLGWMGLPSYPAAQLGERAGCQWQFHAPICSPQPPLAYLTSHSGGLCSLGHMRHTWLGHPCPGSRYLRIWGDQVDRTWGRAAMMSQVMSPTSLPLAYCTARSPRHICPILSWVLPAGGVDVWARAGPASSGRGLCGVPKEAGLAFVALWPLGVVLAILGGRAGRGSGSVEQSSAPTVGPCWARWAP